MKQILDSISLKENSYAKAYENMIKIQRYIHLRDKDFNQRKMNI